MRNKRMSFKMKTGLLSVFFLAAALGYLSPDILSADLPSPCFLSSDLLSLTAQEYTCRTVEYRDPNNPNRAGWIVDEERGRELILHVGNDDSNETIYQRIYGRSMGMTRWLRIGKTWQDALNTAREKCREWLKKNTETPPPIQTRNAEQKPFVAEMVIEQRHLTLEKAQVRVSARVEYPDIGAYRPSNVLFTVRMGQMMKTFKAQDPGIVQRGSDFFLTSVMEIDKAGEYFATVILRDQSFRRSEDSAALAYENEMRVRVKVRRPAAEIKAIYNQVLIARADPTTASGGRRLGRQGDDFSSPKNSWFKLDGPSPFPPGDWAENPFADETVRQGLPDRNRFVYEGDKIGLRGEAGRPRLERTHSEWNIILAEVSSIELEWDGGIRGKAIWGRQRFTTEGDFVIGNTRGTSGQWRQSWGEWAASGCTWLFEQGLGQAADAGIEWLLLRPGVGTAYIKSPAFMVFDLSAGGTVYDEIVYVALNSSVYIRPGAGQVDIYTFEGSPEVLAPSNSAPVALKPGQMVTVKPGSMTAPRAFEPRELSSSPEPKPKEVEKPAKRVYDFSVWPLEHKLNVALERLDQANRSSQSVAQRNGYSQGRDLVELSKREYLRFQGPEGPLFSGSTDPADCPHGLMKVLRICHEEILQSHASWQRSSRSPDMTEAAIQNASDAIRAAEEAMARAVQTIVDQRGWRTHTGQSGATVQAPPAFEAFKSGNWPLALRVLDASRQQVERSVLITWHAKPENLSELEFQDQAIAEHKRDRTDLRDLETWQHWPGVTGSWFSYRYTWEGQEIKALIYQNPWGPLPWEVRYLAPVANFDIEECEEIVRSLERN